MGIPKFFRFMSERYPLISQLIQENRIPEFDALYLDMNGIIHNCSHPNDNDASYRITEDAIFLAVFNYIAHLFSVIRPQKLFFLAIDGVAPRAKMNQQRSRRFRTAKEMKELVDKARSKGEDIPEGDGFDSNCITPGTPFMARLSAQLKYFIAKKVTEDADWRNVEIVLSGHEVPGEGEHKIMEYIRLHKAQPGYDPNVRHCLYGLDADLIMLGLLSHDPHFCLLREEVTFGAKGGKGKSKGLESQNFFLLHLSLFREYLDLEFSALKSCSPALPFEYDLERIIDDFILLNIFVGNDFLPHLPGLHINDGALGRLFEIYKKILPHAGGYLNEHGILNVKRLQLVLDELTVFEMEHFEHDFADSNWFKGKQTKHIESMEKARARNKLVLTKEQRKLFFLVKAFIKENIDHLSPDSRLVIPNILLARDRRFIDKLAAELNLVITYDEFDAEGINLVVLLFDAELLNLANEISSDEDEAEPASGEWKSAIERVLKKYEKAEVAKDFDENEWEDEHAKQLQEKMNTWKKEYYREKLEFSHDDQAAVDRLAFIYIEGLQWVLHYYYGGVASWSWFYPYHYAPKISDLSKASTYTFKFDLGTPFHPFEQLMGVLPDLSSSHIPVAFRDLMSDPASPIIDFYPVNFELDLNGKKQDWEAIVKIPFIDQKRLLDVMAIRAPRLTAEERARNAFGDSWRATYTEHDYLYPSSLPGVFPDIAHCHCRLAPFHLPTLEGGLSYVKGLVPGVLLGKDAIAGFPSLQTIPYTGQLGYHGVSVFQGESRNETMVITLDSPYDDLPSEEAARMFVGKRAYTGYPYLREGLVVAVSDELFRYEVSDAGGSQMVVPTPHSAQAVAAWRRAADRLQHGYSKKLGCVIGHVGLVAHVRLLKGLTLQVDGSSIKEYEDREQEFAIQTILETVVSEDARFVEQPAIPIQLEYPAQTKVFFLSSAAYGYPATVVDHAATSVSINIAYFANEKMEPNQFRSLLNATLKAPYIPSHLVTRQVRMSGLTLSKITSSVMVTGNGDQKTNIGLNLKFEAKSQKVLGYSQKNENGWEFSQKAIALIQQYNVDFPEIATAFDKVRGSQDLSRASDFFGHNADARLKELKAWLVAKGVRDFEKVPLYSEQLEKETVGALEAFADRLRASKLPGSIKMAIIKAIPRQALLKPAHAATRTRDQRFGLGDRVVMVADTGAVPISLKGTVVGIQVGLIDVLFDVAFMGGTTLGDRCSLNRGHAVSPSTLLNLSDPQFAADLGGPTSHPPPTNAPLRANSHALFKRGPRGGPAILPAHGLPTAGWHPAPSAPRNRGFSNGGVTLLKNPARPFTGNYGGAARNDAPPPAAVASSTPDSFTHLQSLGAALGIPVSQPSRAQPPAVHAGEYSGIQRGGLPSRGQTSGFQHAGPNGGHAPFAARGRGRPRGGATLPFPNAFASGVPSYTTAQRGTSRPTRGVIALSAGNAHGVAIPPPPHLAQASARGRGGRGRGTSRGGLGVTTVES